MDNNKWNKYILVTSLIITIIIFSIGILITYSIDFIRIDKVLKTINYQRLNTDAYLTEKEFIDVFGGSHCQLMAPKISSLQKDIREVGSDLSKYGDVSILKKKDFDYLKRKYFLLELKLYGLINNINHECDKKYIPILFFYDTEYTDSETQGYILSDLSEKYPNNLIVFAFDKNYEDEPLLNILISRFNITKTPTIIINNEIKIDRLIYLKEIEQIAKKDLSDIDKNAKYYDLTFTLEATGTNVDDYISELDKQLDKDISDFAKGDMYLILGRLINNDNVICLAAEYYKNVSYDIKEEKALALETLGSLNCDKNKSGYYLEASSIWRSLGNYFRAEIDKRLADDEPLKFYYNIDDIHDIKPYPKEWNRMIIGNSSFILDSSDIIVSQSDRVTRDWLSLELNQSPYGNLLLTVFSERNTLPAEELFPEIGWHEGGRIKELIQSGAKNIIASGTIVKNINDTWYAPDETGIFRFEVPIDKVFYPTTRFLKEDLAVIIDTHGINMLVEQAIRNKATVVIGCGDHPGKIKAAEYLSSKGIKVITFPDKYDSLILNSGADVFGSPPITRLNSSFLIGGRPITITPQDKIVVINVSSDKFAISYYQTPLIYFSNLQKVIRMYPSYITVDDFNETYKVINQAEQENANFIAVRVYNKADYNSVSSWLEEDIKHKAILFHSMPYPYGYKIFEEFPYQTTFGDINPIIE